MARICRDDLPDGLSEIFLQRGLDSPLNKLPDGQITWADLAAVTSDGCAKPITSMKCN
jgi:hypothetical protein